MTSRRSPPTANDSRADEAATLTNDPSSGKETASKEFPYGKSLFREVWSRDPASTAAKSLSLVLMVTGLTCLIFMTNIVRALFPLTLSYWDEKNEVDGALLSLPYLIHRALHLPLETVCIIFQVTAGLCVHLIIADVLTAGPDTCKTSPWPKSWKTDNTICYHEMFSEPTRFGRLLRRPGNSLSNAPFFLASICVLSSVMAQQIGESDKAFNAFWLADAEFGIMLFILAVSSFFWHSSNAPFSQYPDMWSMDCCILYLIVRHIGMATLGYLWKYTDTSPRSAKTVAGTVAFVLYTAVVLLGGWDKWSWYQKASWHGTCPISVRARLSGAANAKNGSVPVWELAVFGAMPFLYISFPCFVQLFLLESTGSTKACDLLTRTLVVGWTYRLLERWVLDGSPLISYFVSTKPSLIQTIGASIFSPTGALHLFTGITLLCAYVHTSTVEQSFEALMTQ